MLLASELYMFVTISPDIVLGRAVAIIARSHGIYELSLYDQCFHSSPSCSYHAFSASIFPKGASFSYFLTPDTDMLMRPICSGNARILETCGRRGTVPRAA